MAIGIYYRRIEFNLTDPTAILSSVALGYLAAELAAEYGKIMDRHPIIIMAKNTFGIMHRRISMIFRFRR